jgi:metal-responsive CopG/Arc/MetJ family transcriptional regulator
VSETVRIRVSLPNRLVEAVDELVGSRNRSTLIEEAVKVKAAHDRLGRALKESAGILSAEDYPAWEAPEKISAWVRELRRDADEGTERKLGCLRQP